MSLTDLIRRDHPQFDMLTEELQRFDSGDTGERYIHTLLQEEFGSTLHHFSTLRLDYDEIDLISVADKSVFLFEIKNIRGNVHIKEHPAQLVRTTDDGQVDTFKSPMSQLEMNTLKLRRFLDDHAISMPIYSAIIFAFNNAIITTDTDRYPIYIGRDVLRFVWQYHTSNTQPNENVVQLLTAQQKQQRYLPKLAKFKLKMNDFRTGVFCPACNFLPMIRQRGKWHCPHCQHVDHHAHTQALNDYYDLISNKITNKQCRQFLHIHDRHDVKQLLKKHCAAKLSKGRNTTYIIKY